MTEFIQTTVTVAAVLFFIVRACTPRLKIRLRSPAWIVKYVRWRREMWGRGEKVRGGQVRIGPGVRR